MITNFDYIILKHVAILCLFISGFIISKHLIKGSLAYVISALIGIIPFALIEGLRYDRGVDYLSYKYIYETTLEPDAQSKTIEPLFRMTNYVLNLIDLPYYFSFVFYSLLLIKSVYYFSGNKRSIMYLSIPFFFVVVSAPAENLVRTYFAFSFILIAIRLLEENMKLIAFLLFLFAFLSHALSLFLIIPIVLFYLLKVKNIPIKFLYPAYLFTWFWNQSWWEKYLNIVGFLNIGGRYDGYVENREQWFATLKEDAVQNSIFTDLRIFLFNSITLILGAKLLNQKNKSHYKISYYLFFVGAFLQKPVENMEIPGRISLLFYTFWFVIVAYIIDDTIRTKVFNKKHLIATSVLIVLIAYEFFIPTINLTTKKMLFIWDK